MRKSDLSLYKYWVTQSGYFINKTTLVLGVSITDGKLFFCHGISEGSGDKKISMREYNNRTVYDWSNNHFPDYCVSPALNLPPITIDNSPRLHKRYHYTPYLLPAAISVASENYVSTLTAPYYLPQILLLPYNDTNTPQNMNEDEPYHGRVKIVYCSSKHDEKGYYKKTRFYWSMCSDKGRKFY